MFVRGKEDMSQLEDSSSPHLFQILKVSGRFQLAALPISLPKLKELHIYDLQGSKQEQELRVELHSPHLKRVSIQTRGFVEVSLTR